MDQSLRLRLVVRRHGLPEARVLFNVPLDNDPTVAQLVELVNESIPLESDDWGLDDYTVELHAKDGHAFECLHFQPVASILEKDDEVFIRPLLTNDLKKRRISGRDQISSGGQHLIDGVPFGRPRLRAPRGRPAVHIAPRKRRRLTYDGDFDQDDLDDIDVDDQGDGGLADQYLVSGHHHDDEDEEGDEPLLLTQHGETKTRKDNRRVHFPRSVTATAEFEDTDSSHGESSEHEEDTEAEDDQDEDMFEPDSEDLREELSGLAEEAADTQRGEIVRDAAEERPSVSAEVNDFGPFTEEDAEPETSKQSKRPNVGSRNRSSHDVSDKVIAVRSAFPAVSGDMCEKLLVKNNYDVGSVWKKLAQQLKPRLDLAQTMVLNTQLELPKEVMVISSPPRNAAEVPGEVSRIGDEDEDATDGPSSADEDEDEDEEDEGEEPEGHATSSESEYDEDSDSDSDASAEDAPAPRTAPDVKDAGSSSSSSDEIGSNDNDKSEAEDRAANPGNRAKGGRQASNHEKQSTGLRSRRRRNVIESSPVSSHATNTKSNAGPDNTTEPARVASPLDSTDSSSSESESDDESEGDSEDTQSESSDSSSDSSSSDSSSDSESDSEVAAPSRTKDKAPAQSANTTPSAKSGPKSATTQSPVQQPVAPGQGMTKTQRRNVRRRIQQAAQRASKSVESSQASAAQDKDLLAKKQALLQSLGVSADASKHAHEPAASKKTATSLENHSRNLSESKDDPDAWRKKISYRAVECVNEGVALTEPPFPFVQRWDALQHGGKRKSRVDSQFYNDTDQNPKKRKLAQPSRKHADNCGVSDDVVLNYDDEPVGLDQGKTDENDLPALPADMSLLPQLSPDDGQPGLIIAWKQLLLTKATNWQPQLSNFMTAVITEADDAGGFRVQLAKRDRDVDKNEKEYDDEGGRVYAKFEVPDDDEEEEADLGYRDISFSEMIDPRVVRRSSDPTTETKISQPPERDVEVADSQRGRNGHTSNNTTSNSDQSRTMDVEQDGIGNSMNVDSTNGPLTGEQSFVPETNHDVVADGVDFGAQPDDTLAQDVSISEERRDEISQLINEGGFRQGVRTSLDQLTFLQFGSPSRQLEEEASSMLPSRQLQSSHRPSSEAASEEAPSEYGSKDPSQQEAHLADAVPVLDDFHSALQTASQLGVNSDNEHVDGVASSHTYSKSGIEYPKLNNSFASQTSARSGRQIDPDFVSHSDDLGHGEDSAMMNGFDDEDVPLNDGAHQTQTSTHEVYNDELPQAKDVMSPLQPFKPTKIGPGGDDRPSSAGSASTGSSSIFVDFELLGSQPVTARFKEHIKGEPLSQATQWMAGLPDINEAHSPAGSKSPVTGRNQSIDGTPASQRSRHLTRSAQQSPQDTNDEESVSQRTRRSSRLMGSVSSSPVATKAGNARKARQHSNDGSPTPNRKTKSLVASFEAPVSPPALSKPRREPSRTPSRSQRG